MKACYRRGMSLVGEYTRQTPHFSLLRRRLRQRAGEVPLEDWVVAQLNRRGHRGAVGAWDVDGLVDDSVTLEELLVSLMTPDATADGRHWKLIFRAIQKGPVDLARLARLAVMERADVLLHWLVVNAPAGERTENVEALARVLHPRDTRPPTYDYDFKRLERRPALREHGWRPPRR